MQIITKRLILRELQLQDVYALVDGLNDFNVAKNLTSPFPYTKQDAINYIKQHDNSTTTDYRFVVTLKESGKVIGGTNITIKENGEYRGGIWLHRDYQGKGYGTELWIARAKFAFDFLKATELANGYYYFNERSKKMQLKIGYKVVGEKEYFCPALKGNVQEIETRLAKQDFEKYYKTIDFEFCVK